MSSGDDRIKMGMTASLSGRYSHPGGQALAGVQAWVDYVNASGGVREREVRLVCHDDRSDARRCAELTERLIVEDRVDLLLGPYSSGLALAAASVAQRHRRLLWNHGGASESIYDRGNEWVVGVLTPARRYFHGIVDRASHPAENVSIVHSTAGAFPREVALGAEERSKERGFSAIHIHSYRPGTRDFGPILAAIDREGPDLVVEVGRIEDDIRFAQQLLDGGIDAGNVGLVATPLTLFRHALGDGVERFLGPSQWEPEAGPRPDYGPSSPEVLRLLEGRRPEGVDYPMAQAFAGCLVAQRCVEIAGSLDDLSLKEAAGRLDFATFYGRFAIDPATGRQVGHTMPVVRWEGGRKVLVAPSGSNPKERSTTTHPDGGVTAA